MKVEEIVTMGMEGWEQDTKKLQLSINLLKFKSNVLDEKVEIV